MYGYKTNIPKSSSDIKMSFTIQQYLFKESTTLYLLASRPSVRGLPARKSYLRKSRNVWPHIIVSLIKFISRFDLVLSHGVSHWRTLYLVTCRVIRPTMIRGLVDVTGDRSADGFLAQRKHCNSARKCRQHPRYNASRAFLRFNLVLR
jgi:hypothetical protein